LNKHNYCVPKEYIGKRVDLIYDAENINIYYGLKLVTIHQRDDTPYTYTQKEAHGLPGHHGSYEKDLEEIYQRAGEIDNILVVPQGRCRAGEVSAQGFPVMPWHHVAGEEVRS
jgi:hypothetical protein